MTKNQSKNGPILSEQCKSHPENMDCFGMSTVTSLFTHQMKMKNQKKALKKNKMMNKKNQKKPQKNNNKRKKKNQRKKTKN